VESLYREYLTLDNSGNESAEFVEHIIDCKENYLGTEMHMCSVVSLTLLLQRLPLNKRHQALILFLQQHLLYPGESLFFLGLLFNMCVVHSLLPNSCLNTSIVPICKNKNGKMTDTSN